MLSYFHDATDSVTKFMLILVIFILFYFTFQDTRLFQLAAKKTFFFYFFLSFQEQVILTKQIQLKKNIYDNKSSCNIHNIDIKKLKLNKLKEIKCYNKPQLNVSPLIGVGFSILKEVDIRKITPSFSDSKIFYNCGENLRCCKKIKESFLFGKNR